MAVIETQKGRDPKPDSVGVQEVIELKDGGWKAVINCDKEDPNCNRDYQFSNPGGGINHRRAYAIRLRMGIA